MTLCPHISLSDCTPQSEGSPYFMAKEKIKVLKTQDIKEGERIAILDWKGRIRLGVLKDKLFQCTGGDKLQIFHIIGKVIKGK